MTSEYASPCCHDVKSKGSGCNEKSVCIPRKTESDQSGSRGISSVQRYKKGFSKEAKVCSCHSTDGADCHKPIIFKNQKHEGRLEDFPNMKIIDVAMDNHMLRNLPKSTTCVPVTSSFPKVSAISGNEIFFELVQVMELQKLGHSMEQEMVNRFKILQELANANNELNDATSQTKVTKSTGKPVSHTSVAQTNRQMNGRPGQNKFNEVTTETANTDRPSQQPDSQTTSDKAREQREQEAKSKERDAFLVLRPDLIVPELRDLPTLREMLTVPTTLTQATRMIFALRRDMLALRNDVLKRSLGKAEEEIEMCRKRHISKNESLLQQLNTMFSKSQLAFIRDGGKREPWTLEDYLQSISLRALCSHHAFEHVRNAMKIPLPSLYSVRSMANCGLMPEVTRRFKELAETRDLSESFKQRARSNGGTDGDSNKRRRLAAGRSTMRDGGAKASPERKRTRDDEELDPLEPLPRRACWDATGVDMVSEREFSEEEAGPGWSSRLSQALPGAHVPRIRLKRSGRQRTGWSGSGAKRTGGKRRRKGAAEPTGSDDVRCSSEDEHHRTDTDVSFSRVLSGRASQRHCFLGQRPESRDWFDEVRPPQVEDWESPPLRSPKKKYAKRKSERSSDAVLSWC